MSDFVFTRGLAFGEGFCNRQVEAKQLQINLRHSAHTLILSPRRYGKTSLALQVLEKSELLYTHVDLFMKYNQTDIETEFYESISQLLPKLIKPSEKAIQLLQSFLQHLKITLSFGEAGLEFSLLPAMDKKASLKNLLIGLESFLIKKNKKIVLFIDEFQTITESPFGEEVEASLRFVAQKTKNIVFIFSGSNRHLLEKLFESKNRPFYKLCYKMQLQKIGREHYQAHINKFARQKWGKNLEETVLMSLLDITTCHPYYVNILCEKIFTSEEFPTEKSILFFWRQVCLEEQGSIGRDLELLTSKQKQLLAEIAKTPDLKEPTAKEFVSRVNLTAKGVLDALKILYKHDLIEQEMQGVISIVDPVLLQWARGF